MDIFSAFKISASGLSAQRIRMNVIASNLANINTTRTPEGGPYKKKGVVFAAVPVFRELLDSELGKNLKGVKAVNIVESKNQPIQVFDPSHPDADDKGYVYMPNINSIEEMINMLSAARSYEANITAINAAKNMAVKALEIGR